jgi:SAM-dependent methyltransferase
VHWDERYRRYGPARADDVGPPPLFAQFVDIFPTVGTALELGCGRGRVAVWLASRGLLVWGLDISPVAIGLAKDLAQRAGLAELCRFDASDLDEGIPEGPPVDVLVSYLFRDSRLDDAIVDRLKPGGLLAVAALSEVDIGSGRFRARPGELRRAFNQLDVITADERNGEAWLLGRQRP